MNERFWEQKSLAELNRQEWEALCDSCGKCCVHKLQDEDDAEIYYTNVVCDLLDANTCRCTDYPNRAQRVPDCLSITPENFAECRAWLPESCGYRCVGEGRPLPEWHPLLTGNPLSTVAAGASVAGRVIAESQAGELEQHLVDWPDS